MKNVILVLSCFLISSVLYSQSGAFGVDNNTIYNEIQETKKKGEKFIEIPRVFKETNGSSEDIMYFKSGKKPMYYHVKIGKILDSNEKNISFKIPLDSEELVVELKDISDTLEDVLVTTNDDTVFKENTIQKHFRGIIKDDKNSLIALSFFEDYVTGFISNPSGNYSLLKLKGTHKHVMYNDNWLKEKDQFECTTPDDDFKGYTKEQLTDTFKTRDLSECVELYFETEFDMYQELGSVSNVKDFVISLYNEVSTIYWNSGIKTAISEIKVWTIDDPFFHDNAHDLLQHYQSYTSGFNGDLGQLLTFRDIDGGRAAGFNGLCNPNQKLSLSVAELENNIIPFPTYSRNIAIIAHEFGHLFGSRHTHACVWNGDNTQIDDCGNKQAYDNGWGIEGFFCFDPANPIIPAMGGTIMSYCQKQSVGINFSLGFHTQVRTLIRNNVDNAACLSSCSDCFESMHIIPDVHSWQVDHKEVSYNIKATNTIYPHAEAIYHAGESVILDSGFTVYHKSVFVAYTEGCTGNFERRFDDIIITEENEHITKDFEPMDIELFPNPTNGVVSIRTSGNFENEIIVLAYDIYGKLAKNTIIRTESSIMNFDLSDLHKGVYFIKLKIAEDVEFNKKVILK